MGIRSSPLPLGILDILQVRKSRFKQHSVMKLSNCHITVIAKKPSNFLGVMIVVNAKIFVSFICGLFAFANGTFSFLLRKQMLINLLGNSIKLFHLVKMYDFRMSPLPMSRPLKAFKASDFSALGATIGFAAMMADLIPFSFLIMSFFVYCIFSHTCYVSIDTQMEASRYSDGRKEVIT